MRKLCLHSKLIDTDVEFRPALQMDKGGCPPERDLPVPNEATMRVRVLRKNVDVPRPYRREIVRQDQTPAAIGHPLYAPGGTASVLALAVATTARDYRQPPLHVS
jgi:hypothetical protein